MTLTITVPLPESGEWVLVANDIAGYLAQSTSSSKIGVYIHTSSSEVPTVGNGGFLESGEAINLPGILWARTYNGKAGTIAVFS